MGATSSLWLLSISFLLLVYGGVEIQASHIVLQNLEALQPPFPNHTYRTSFHFQPSRNWMNGPMVYKGVYHFFYQYNPKGASFGKISWGHSTSKDLLNWRAHIPALSPSQPAADINGAWSGSATILPNGLPALLYTGVDSRNRQVQNLAVPKNPSDPYLQEWVKSPRNPLISPNHYNKINATSFRDPTTAWRGPDGNWRILIGSKVARRGLAILYRSKDFVRWVQAKRPLHSADGSGMWECPDFYPVSTNPTGLDTSLVGSRIKHVLKISLDESKHDYYTIGTYDHARDKYIPDKGSVDNDSGLRYDYGKFYASKTFYDSLKRRRILWGWINESLIDTEYVKQGWSGVQGIPRTVWLDKSGKQLVQWPVQELEKLRSNKVEMPSSMLKKGSVSEVSGISAAQADVEVTFKIMEFGKAEKMEERWRADPQVLCSQKGASVRGGIGPFGLKVLASQNRQEYTAVFFRVFKGNNNNPVVLMCSDQTRSSLDKKTDKTSYGAFVDIDHSIVESFGAKGKVCITSRVYPTKAIGGKAHLYFSKYGDVIDSVIMMDKVSGRPRGGSEEDSTTGRTLHLEECQKQRKYLLVDEMKEYFSSYGSVVEHQIMLDHNTGRRSRGFGFVEIKRAEPKRAGGDRASESRMHRGNSNMHSYGNQDSMVDYAGMVMDMDLVDPLYGAAAAGYSGNSYVIPGNYGGSSGYAAAGAGKGYVNTGHGGAKGYGSVGGDSEYDGGEKSTEGSGK
nr:beta-fructofuranosidase, insoluble isoenzyme CWINV1-like [Ipomoea batatas]